MAEAEAIRADAPFVFLSYARDDARWVEALAAEIERRGLNVWWDRQLRGGEAFGNEIERALEGAAAVLVVWSDAAKRSRWVLDEASSAADRGLLVPIALAGAAPPLGFRQAHTIPFSGGPPARDASIPALIDALNAKLGSAEVTLPGQARRGWRWARSSVAVAAVGAVALGAAAMVWLPRQQAAPSRSSANAPAEAVRVTAKSVAVLPFRALSAGAEDGYFADGVTEEVINSLGTVGGLRVTGRTSSFSFKARDLPTTEIARTLGVAHIVEGSVRRTGDRVRVSARLVRAADGFQMWQANYDRAAGDPFNLQSDIAAHVARALEVVMDERTTRVMAMRRITNVEAFVAFQKGLELYRRAHGDSPLYATLKLANAQFDRAIALAPGLSDAYLLRADLPSHLVLATASQTPMPPEIGSVDVVAEREQLNSDLNQAYKTSGTPARRVQLDFVRTVVSDDWAGLGQKLDATLSTAGCVELTWLEQMHPFGRSREIAAYYDRIAGCDPLSSDVGAGAAWARLSSGQPEIALNAVRRMRKEHPNNRVLAQIELRALMQLARYVEARQLLASDPLWSGRLKRLGRLETLRLERVGRFETLRLERLVGNVGAAERLEADEATNPGSLDRKLLIAAWKGDRAGAARLARQIDGAAMGHMSLLDVTFRCMCGAPFPIEATPRLRGKIAAAGFAWAPRPLLRFPQKAW